MARKNYKQIETESKLDKHGHHLIWILAGIIIIVSVIWYLFF